MTKKKHLSQRQTDRIAGNQQKRLERLEKKAAKAEQQMQHTQLGDRSTRLGALTLNSSGTTTLAQSVKAASVTSNADGTLRINGGSVDTTGAQTYGEAAVLGANTTLSGTTVSLSAGADASAAGAQASILVSTKRSAAPT